MNLALELCGRPYEHGASGPHSFDCWGLVRHIYKQELGIEIQPYNDGYDGAGGPFDAFAAHIPDWEAIANPTPLCVVAMGRTKRIHHCGVYLDLDGGMVLHADRPTVQCTPLSRLPSIGWRTIKFYQWPLFTT